MIKLRNVMKGISFILCLGFFVYVGNASAKSYSYEEITQLDDYKVCASAQSYIQKYNTLGKCANETTALENVQARIGQLCAAFQNNKSEYKKCTSGEKTSIDETKLRMDADGSKGDKAAIEKRIQDVKDALQEESTAKSNLSTCESNQKSYLKSANEALDKCKSDAKDASKDEKKAKEAQEKANKATDEANAAKQAFETAENAYNQCVQNNGGSDDKCQKEYKAYVKAAENYNKKAQKADDKQSTADSKKQDADASKLASKQNSCSSGELWSTYFNMCLPADDVSKCGNNSEGKFFYGKETKKCYDSASARDVAEENFDNAQQSYNTAKDAYDQCISEHADDAETACKTQKDSLDSSLTAYTNLGGEATLGTPKGEAGEAGEAGGAAVTPGEIDEAKGVKSCAELKQNLGGSSDLRAGGQTYNIFKYIACRITVFVADLRAIIYAFAGFGLIFCAYNAVMGKLSFKHLASIAVGLFILSMTTSFIEYILYNNNKTDHLEFGHFLPNGDHENYKYVVTGADFAGANCGTHPELCPDSMLAEKVKNDKGWNFWDDIGGTISSITDGISTITNAYSTAANFVSSAGDALGNIKDAIKGENDQTRAAEADLKATKENLAAAQENLAAAQAALAPAQLALDAAQAIYNAAVAKVNQDREEINAMQNALNSGDYSQYLSDETKNKVAEAENNLKDKQQQLDDLKKLYEEQLKQEDPEKAKAVADAEEAVKKDQEELDKLNKLLYLSGEELEKAMQEFSKDDYDKMNSCKLELDDANKAIEEQKENLAANQEKLAMLNDALNSSKLENEIANAEKRVADLQAQIDALDPSRPAQAAQIEQLKKQQAEAQAKADAARERQNELNSLYGEMSPEEIQELIASVKADIEDNKYLLNEQKNAANNAQKCINDSQNSAKEHIKSLIAQKQADLNEHKETLNQAKKDLETSKSEAAKEAQAKIKAAEQEVQDAKKALNDANTAARKEVQDAISAKNQELRNDQAALNDAQQSLNQAQATFNSAQSAITNAQNDVDAWERAVDQAQANYDAAKDGAGDFLTNVGKVATNVAALTSSATYTATSLANATNRVANDVNDAGKSGDQRETCNIALSQLQRLNSLCENNPILAKQCTPGNQDLECVNHPEYYECSKRDGIQAIIDQYKCTTGVQNWMNTTGNGILNDLQNASNNANSVRDGVGAVNNAYNNGNQHGSQISGDVGSVLGNIFAAGEAVSQGVNMFGGK